jgi:putative ABC transport system permease protein
MRDDGSVARDTLVSADARRTNVFAALQPFGTRVASKPGMTIPTGLTRDVRYALRTLRRTPAFTILAVLILALGIGANTAIFSLVSAVLLKPLPFVEPDRLVTLWTDASANGGPSSFEASPANFVDWKERNRSFEDVAGFANTSYNLTGEGEPQRLAAARTTPNLFSILGLQPLAGRTFGPDETAEASSVVVISESLWINRFAADPTVVGREISLDGSKYTVIGVVPPDFETPSSVFAGEIDVWMPTAFSAEELARRGAYYMYVVARLRPNVTLQQARADMTSVASALAQEYPRTNGGSGAFVAPLQEHLALEARPMLFMLLGAVGILLLITCANVANLLLARGAGRSRELGLRKALGAGHGRVLRQLLTESAVLAGLGLVLGTTLAAVSFGYLTRLVPATFPQGTNPSLDWRVLAFTAAIALSTVLLFGVGPAFAAARVGLADALKKGIGRVSGRGRLGGALVVAEITLTVVLLAAAGLLLRSYAQVLAEDPGFRPDNLLIAQTDLPSSKYAELASRSAFYDRVLERIKALPGVENAGYANYAPLLFKGGRVAVTIEGGPALTPENIAQYVVSDRSVTAGYLETLGVPLLGGRHFDGRDTATAPLAAVINQGMAQKYWHGEDATGKRFKIGGPDNPWITVVGIVGDIRQMGLDIPAEPELYLSADQPVVEAPFFWARHLLVRTRVEPLTLAAAVRSAIWEIDPDQPVSSIRTMNEVFDSELANRNTQLTLVGAFAVLALVLAAVGLYGVLSYSVAQRTPEIGLRMALGAQHATVLRSVVGGAMVLAVLGLALGTIGALALTRVLTSFLFGVSPTDPLTFAAAAAVLLLVTGAAAYLPARRAASVDPMAALRDE